QALLTDDSRVVLRFLEVFEFSRHTFTPGLVVIYGLCLQFSHSTETKKASQIGGLCSCKFNNTLTAKHSVGLSRLIIILKLNIYFQVIENPREEYGSFL